MKMITGQMAEIDLLCSCTMLFNLLQRILCYNHAKCPINNGHTLFVCATHGFNVDYTQSGNITAVCVSSGYSKLLPNCTL